MFPDRIIYGTGTEIDIVKNWQKNGERRKRRKETIATRVATSMLSISFPKMSGFCEFDKPPSGRT